MKTLKVGRMLYISPNKPYYLYAGDRSEPMYWRVRAGLQYSKPTYFPTPEAAIAAAEAEGWTVEL